jgi:hypothetical protein
MTIHLPDTDDGRELAKRAYHELTTAEMTDLAWAAWLTAIREGRAALERVLRGKVDIEWERGA